MPESRIEPAAAIAGHRGLDAAAAGELLDALGLREDQVLSDARALVSHHHHVKAAA